MNKKVVFGILAVLAFFGGAIWVSEVPTIGTLVALLELLAGGALGFFFCKELDNNKMQNYETTIEGLKAKLNSQIEVKKVKVVPVKKSTKTKE